MPLTWRTGSLKMQWCLACHRAPEAVLRPRDQVFDMDEQTPEADQTLADRVVAHLTQAIISGELRPGTRLSEPKLDTQTRVTRGPPRKSTRRQQKPMPGPPPP